MSDEVKDFPVVESKSLVEMKLNALRQEAKSRAQGVAKEEIVEMPPDIDTNRLAEIAEELKGTPERPPLSPPTSGGHAKAKIEEHKQKLNPETEFSVVQGINALVLSVTTKPFVPAKASKDGIVPDPTQKYHILIETTVPLQLGKEYQITL